MAFREHVKVLGRKYTQYEKDFVDKKGDDKRPRDCRYFPVGLFLALKTGTGMILRTLSISLFHLDTPESPSEDR